MNRSVRPFLFPCCLLLLNAFGLWQGLRMWEAHLQGDSGEPEVIFSPGDLERISGKEIVRWRWSRPVVGPDQVGVLPGEAPVTIDPPLAGAFRWTSEQELEFEPLEDWPVARTLRFELQTLATNAQRQLFSLRHHSKVLGAPLNVTAAEPLYVPGGRQLQIRLRMNAPVDLLELRKHVRLFDDQDQSVDLSVQETPQADEFLLSAYWLGKNPVTLRVLSGMRSVYGEGAVLADERSFTFKELEHFSLTGFEVEQPTFGPGEVELSFSDRPSLQSVMNGLRVEPAVKFSVGGGKWWRDQSCVVRGDFEPGKRYRFRLAEGIRSQNGVSLSEKIEREVIMPARKPGLKFAHNGWILNAKGAAQVEVLTENEGAVDLSLDRVHKNNLVAYAVRASGEDGWQSENHPDRTLSEIVLERRIDDVESGSTSLDLSETLKTSGQGIYRLRVTGKNSRRQIDKIIALSDVGLLARKTGDELLVWALRLDSAQVVPEMEISLWSDTRQLLVSGKTNEEGLCVLKMEDSEAKGAPLLVLAQKESSLGLLSLLGEQAFPGQNGERPYLQQGNEAFVYTERGMYRPEETVHVRAIVRGKNFALPGRFPVELRMVDLSGLPVWKKQLDLSELGTVEAAIELKPEWPNGPYRIRVSLPGDDAPLWGSTTVHLESFAPPQVVVKAFTPEGEQAVPEQFSVKVDARMLYGAPASAHKGKAVLTLVPETFRSSEYPDHVFSDSRKAGFGQWSRPLGEFTTDSNGLADIVVRVPEDKTGPSAVRAVVGISVNEFSGREASSFVSRRVDRVPYYLGMKIGKTTEREVSVDVVGVLSEGGRISGASTLEMAWYRVNRQHGYRRDARGRFTWFSDEVDVLEGKREVEIEAGQVVFPVKIISEGVYRVAVRDPATGFSCSQKVMVGRGAMDPERADRVELALDQESFVPGEEATLSVSAPFSGRVLLTLESDKLLMHQTLEMEGRQAELKFTVPESSSANLWLRASLVRPQPGGGAAPVLRSEGVLALQIKTDHLVRPLELEVADEVRPSKDVEIRVMGEPGAEVIVAGVDEGILLLSDFKTPDPLSWFLALRRAISVSWDSFDDLLPELGMNAFAGDAKMGGGIGSAIRKRLNPVDAKRFRPLSWWSGARKIPESGELILQMPMPEFSGMVRWMAVQVSEGGMGHAEAFSKVGREVIVQQSVPLFLAPGDETLWTLRVHNRGEHARTVTLKPTVRGPVEFMGEGLLIQLDPGEVLNREFSLKASDEIGKAEVVLGIQVGDEFWQDRMELAVRPVEAFELRTTRTIIPEGQELKIEAGAEMLSGTGQRSLQVSSMPVLQLGVARSFLLRYPYGCLEQTVSAASPALYMKGWAEGTADGAKQMVRAGIMELWKKQKRDGSFGYWDSGDQTSVSGSLGALMFLLEAKDLGYEVHEASLQAGVDWTRSWMLGQQWSTEENDLNLQITRACKVLAMAGELDAGWMQRLRERSPELGGYARVMAAESMMRGDRRALGLEMLEGLTTVDRGWGWNSSVAGNAELLWVLLKLNPEDGRIYSLVEKLLSQRNEQGRWSQTYENAQVIRAFVEYAKVWPGENGEWAVEWRGKENQSLKDGLSLKLDEGEKGTLRNDGDGPVYVEIRTEGVPLEPSPVINTFMAERSLLRLDGRSVADDSALKSGETLMMRFKISRLPGRVKYLALDQRLPAGLEAFPFSRQQKPWNQMHSKPGYEVSIPRHLEVRDDRVLLFPGEIDPGEKNYFVLVRAVSPGSYRFPALFAQDMYEESLVSRGSESRLVVVP